MIIETMDEHKRMASQIIKTLVTKSQPAKDCIKQVQDNFRHKQLVVMLTLYSHPKLLANKKNLHQVWQVSLLQLIINQEKIKMTNNINQLC